MRSNAIRRAAVLRAIAEDPELLEIGRKAIEDTLVELRDSRIAILGRNNGLVIREADGRDSSMIRLGPEMALRIALEAMAKTLAGST